MKYDWRLQRNTQQDQRYKVIGETNYYELQSSSGVYDELYLQMNDSFMSEEYMSYFIRPR